MTGSVLVRISRHLLSVVATAVMANAAGPVLTPGTPIYLSSSADGPVRRAVQDLRRDLRQTLGADSPILDRLPDPAQPCIVILGPGEQPSLRLREVNGFESHAVFVPAAHPAQVVLQGEDTRGVIFSIYTFSEHVLGVPPLWFWSSWEAAKRNRIDVKSDLKLVFPPAAVKWRAWFPNDEDLLTPWRARSGENFEAFIETMLRLKLNTREGSLMDDASFDTPYSIGREARTVRDRGLVFTGHHVYIFGSSYRHWDAFWRKIRKTTPPALSAKNVDALRDFWRYHIEAGMKSGVPTIWQLGFRGSRDIPFWETFADSPTTDAERAATIQSMMTLQVQLVKEVTGDPAPLMRATFYNENSDFVAQGLLRPPTDKSLIWVFVAARRDHFPAADVRNIHPPKKSPVGYYLNFQFTSSGAHLASAEGPWKMEQNYRLVRELTARPLTFSVVNAGNIREFLLELSANAAMMWDFNGFDATRFVQRFCQQYFGEQAGAAASLYRRFYDSYWQQRKPTLPGFERQYVFQDMRYARALEQLLVLFGKPLDPNPLQDRGLDRTGRYFGIVPGDQGAADQLSAILKGTGRSIEQLDEIVRDAGRVMDRMPASERTLFNDHLLVQAEFMLELNRTLQSVVQGLRMQPESGSVRFHLERARASAERMQQALAKAEHGRFQGWYSGDRLFGVARVRQLIDQSLESLTR